MLGLKPGDMVAVMGAGGKATLTKRLVIELVAAGTPVLVTGTTNLHSLEDWRGPSTFTHSRIGAVHPFS
jgi:hypothetical protein